MAVYKGREVRIIQVVQRAEPDKVSIELPDGSAEVLSLANLQLTKEEAKKYNVPYVEKEEPKATVTKETLKPTEEPKEKK